MTRHRSCPAKAGATSRVLRAATTAPGSRTRATAPRTTAVPTASRPDASSQASPITSADHAARPAFPCVDTGRSIRCGCCGRSRGTRRRRFPSPTTAPNAPANAAVVGTKAVYAIPDPATRANWEIVVAPIGWHRGFAVGVLVVAALAGALGAVVGDGNLRLLVPRDLPQQPHRMLRPVSTQGKAGLAAWSALVIGLAWLEASGRLAVGTAVVLGAVALVLLPGAVVAARRTREVAPAFAGHDLWRVMVGGRALLVDYPVQGVAQLDGPVPEGAVVPPHRLGDPPYPVLLI